MAIVWIYKKKLKGILHSRSVELQGAVTRAKQELADAQSMLAQAKRRHEEVAGEKKDLKNQFAVEAKKMSELAVSNAKESAESIARDTARRIENEYNQAVKEVRAEVVQLATQRARERLERELTDDVDKQLRDQVIQGVE